jgi:hypothetical protein
MTARIAPMSVLLAAALLVLAPPLPWRGGPLAAQSMQQQRLAQLRRPTDERGDPSEPGGLPGRSGRSDDSRPTTRGLVKPKKAAPDTDKGKAEERTKKDQK